MKKNNNLILCGSYRSGTTWLMELFSAGLDKQYNFEPLEPKANSKVRKLRLRNRYLSPNKNYKDFNSALEEIVNGKVMNSYVKAMSFSPLRMYRWKFWAKKQIIKFVQGHLLLGYIYKKFDFKNILLILRHPCAVIESLKRQEWWGSDIEEFLDGRQKDLFKEYPQLKAYVKEILTFINNNYLYGDLRKIALTITRYCIENYVPLIQKREKEFNYSILYYEDIFMNPLQELNRLSEELEIKFNDNLINNKIEKPSKTTNIKSAVKDEKYTPLNKWKHNLSKREKKLVLKIVQKFNLNELAGNRWDFNF